ncbi:FRG domain-containing protein [Pseudomonas syringae pv. syringae]|uniref:FRG domain-containing protein n=1 Tax=Pseudomonas syringae TaxID=317 RepID=UPI00200B05DA|nr:FRG domain-containing protein [Pseudomonas syringae]MCK9750804.1 FRG domain-containing protein [Pseudomonas syringae pv. syringae]
MASPTERHFDTARQLLDYVSPLNEIWKNGQYVFRGQPSDEYKLTPSVCRNDKGSFGYESPRRMFDKSSSGQLYYELEIVKKFLDGCDRSGLIVPGYTEQIRDRLLASRRTFMSGHLPWPQQEMHQIMAVAQHYEVPTRLLDWTDRSFVACYFAASSASFEIDVMGMPKIAVWALETSPAPFWQTVKIIRPPGGTSLNQAAQSGLFSAHQARNYRTDDVYIPDALEDVQEIYETSIGIPAIIKMTLPLSEAPELLDLCSKMGVDGSTLFPGFHGAAKMVKDWANIEIGVRHSQSAIDEHRMDNYDPDCN